MTAVAPLIRRRPVAPIQAMPVIEARREDAAAAARLRSCFFRGWIFARALIPHLPAEAAAQVRASLAAGEGPMGVLDRLQAQGYVLPPNREAIDRARQALGLRPIPRPSPAGPLLTAHPPIDGLDC